MPGINIGNAGSHTKSLEDEDDDEGRGRLVRGFAARCW